jgi:large conductance mechanosensitive channel
VGLFLADVFNFLIVALALFIFIQKFLGFVLRTKKEEVVTPPPLTRDQELLTEIRDLLTQKPPA